MHSLGEDCNLLPSTIKTLAPTCGAHSQRLGEHLLDVSLQRHPLLPESQQHPDQIRDKIGALKETVIKGNLRAACTCCAVKHDPQFVWFLRVKDTVMGMYHDCSVVSSSFTGDACPSFM